MKPPIWNFDSRQIVISVAGAGVCSGEVAALAFETGRHIARKGAVLLCGGLGGVMEAAARGAREAGGLTIGLLPGIAHQDANSFISIALPTGMGHARNALIAQACHGMVAVAGSLGTLSEIALALKMGKPVATLESWNLDIPARAFRKPEDAVTWVIGKIR